MNLHDGFWTDERIQELKDLWAEGWSALKIGRKLRVSRNTVIGKVHRLGFHLTVTRKKQKRAPRVPKPKMVKPAKPTPKTSISVASIAPKDRGRPNNLKITAPSKKSTPPIVIPETIAEIAAAAYEVVKGVKASTIALQPDQCRYSYGTPHPSDPDFHFCPNRKRPGSIFCDGHKMHGHQPLKPKAKPYEGNPRGRRQA